MLTREPAVAVVPGRGDCYNSACIAHDLLGHVTSRWGVLVLGALLGGTLRFSQVRLRIDGISEKMLAQKLREFERDGLIARRTYAVVPPRVEYTLTAAGREVAGRLSALIGWLEEHIAMTLEARLAYDEAHETNGLIAG